MKVVFTILLACISIMAQETSALKQKYGATESETYRMRDGVYLTVTPAQTGEICEMIITPAPPLSYLNGRRIETFSVKSLTDIIDELVPLNQRGKFIKQSRENVSCFPDCGYSGDVFEYERVVIFRIKVKGKNQERYAQIIWRQATCEN